MLGLDDYALAPSAASAVAKHPIQGKISAPIWRARVRQPCDILVPECGVRLHGGRLPKRGTGDDVQVMARAALTAALDELRNHPRELALPAGADRVNRFLGAAAAPKVERALEAREPCLVKFDSAHDDGDHDRHGARFGDDLGLAPIDAASLRESVLGAFCASSPTCRGSTEAARCSWAWRWLCGERSFDLLCDQPDLPGIDRGTSLILGLAMVVRRPNLRAGQVRAGRPSGTGRTAGRSAGGGGRGSSLPRPARRGPRRERLIPLPPRGLAWRILSP